MRAHVHVYNNTMRWRRRHSGRPVAGRAARPGGGGSPGVTVTVTVTVTALVAAPSRELVVGGLSLGTSAELE